MADGLPTDRMVAPGRGGIVHVVAARAVGRGRVSHLHRRSRGHRHRLPGVALDRAAFESSTSNTKSGPAGTCSRRVLRGCDRSCARAVAPTRSARGNRGVARARLAGGVRLVVDAAPASIAPGQVPARAVGSRLWHEIEARSSVRMTAAEPRQRYPAARPKADGGRTLRRHRRSRSEDADSGIRSGARGYSDRRQPVRALQGVVQRGHSAHNSSALLRLGPWASAAKVSSDFIGLRRNRRSSKPF